ncbi:MAG: helix-turn-helix domain-containing protein [Desulfomonilaceae bacterium]
MEHGYSQAEIAAHVGLHYSTVSRIVQREREKARNKT